MLGPWLAPDGAPQLLESFSAAAGVDLAELGCNADAATIRDTSVAQPLIVAASLLSYHALGLELAARPSPDVTAGHSVGEFAAAVLAGSLGPSDAVRLVGVRGAAMARAAATGEPTGMAALLGGDPGEIDAALARTGLVGANVNGAGQLVVAGPVGALDALAAQPPARTRVVRLEVAGAFHTAAMADATAPLAREFAEVDIADPEVSWLSNADGTAMATGRQVVERLVAQVTAPVRWDLVMARMAELGVSGVLELAPAGVLTGLVKRAVPSAATFALTSPDLLAEAAAFVAEHREVAP